jgi:hypothetical protein
MFFGFLLSKDVNQPFGPNMDLNKDTFSFNIW